MAVVVLAHVKIYYSKYTNTAGVPTFIKRVKAKFFRPTTFLGGVKLSVLRLVFGIELILS